MHSTARGMLSVHLMPRFSKLPSFANRHNPGPHAQVLVCVYFFLCGVAVATGRLLWVLPLATGACVGVHWLAGAASQLALPFYKELPAERAALWRMDVAHLCYSSLTGAPFMHVASRPRCPVFRWIRSHLGDTRCLLTLCSDSLCLQPCWWAASLWSAPRPGA